MWYWTRARLHFVRAVRFSEFNGREWVFSDPVPMVMDDFGELVQCRIQGGATL